MMIPLWAFITTMIATIVLAAAVIEHLLSKLRSDDRRIQRVFLAAEGRRAQQIERITATILLHDGGFPQAALVSHSGSFTDEEVEAVRTRLDAMLSDDRYADLVRCHALLCLLTDSHIEVRFMRMKDYLDAQQRASMPWHGEAIKIPEEL